MVTYPNNPIARESVRRYTEAMKSVFHRVAGAGRCAGRMQLQSGPEEWRKTWPTTDRDGLCR